MTFSFLKILPHKTFIRRITHQPLVCLLYPVAIFGAASAPEDAHNICLSEQLAPIMKFPTRIGWLVYSTRARASADMTYK